MENHTSDRMVRCSEPKITWRCGIGSNKVSRTCPNCMPVRGSETMRILLQVAWKSVERKYPPLRRWRMRLPCANAIAMSREALVDCCEHFGVDDSIEGFERFSCKKHGWSKAMYMFWQVEYIWNLDLLNHAQVQRAVTRRNFLISASKLS